MNVENVIVELVGATSTYKSTLTNQLAGSVWGGGNTKLGYATSWNATPNAVENVCRNYNNCLLVLDEATAAGSTPKSRADNILNTAHRISLGRSKARLGGDDPVSYDLMALSNSNEPLCDILTSCGAVAGAADVRILSFNCADPKFGYLQPALDEDGAESPLGPQLRALCTTHYGHVAPRFILHVLAACATDHEGFKKQINRYMNKFLDHFKITAQNEAILRRAKPFALTYACAKLTKQFQMIDESWGETGSAIFKAYRKFITQGQPAESMQEIARFLSDKSKKIVDRYGKSRPSMTDGEFAEIDAFIVKVKGKRVLAISPTAFKRNFPDNAALPSQLARHRMLIKSEGNQFKKCVRQHSDGSVIKDRFYIIKVTKWPKRFAAATKLQTSA